MTWQQSDIEERVKVLLQWCQNPSKTLKLTLSLKNMKQGQGKVLI